ncbi:hypothetical protein D3C78_618470 [compost metagenome]
MLDQFLQGRLLVEEVLKVVGAVFGPQVLELTIRGSRQLTQQNVFAVARKQGVPLRAPEHLDHVPAGTTEQRFQLLDDLAITAHRPIQALQVAVDHKGEVIQLLARGQGQAGDGFRLVHLTIAEHTPDMPGAGVEQLAIVQVAHEARLVDRIERTDTHGTGGKLPEVGHQPGVWIGAQTIARDLLTVAGQLLFTQSPFEKRPGIDARR